MSFDLSRRELMTAIAAALVAAGCSTTVDDENAEEGQAALGSKSQRIAIVGGGPAGISAAYALKKKGYTRVTIFEKEAALGGKVSTFVRNGKPNEMGAVYATQDYKHVLGIARELGIPLLRDDKPLLLIDTDGKMLSFPEFLEAHWSKPEVARAFTKFSQVLFNYGALFDKGNHAAKPELFVPFETFAKSEGIEPVAELFRSTMVGCGYGYYEEVPALYIVKLLKTWFLNGLREVEAAATLHLRNEPTLLKFPGGFQQFFIEVAKASGAKVRLRSAISAIRRTGATVSVTVGGSSEEFDSVILAAPLPAMLAALDASSEERDLMSRIKTYRYFATLFEDTKLPDGNSLFLHGKSRPAQLGETIIFGNFSYEPRLWTSYQLADRRAAPANLKTQLAKDSRALGGAPGAILMQKEWDYFPHVGSADLEANFYPRMEALQGKNRTYYAGGVMNFESTEFAAEYSQRLVDRFF